MDISFVFIELGIAIVGLAILTRLASRFGFSAIPLYLLAGLAFVGELVVRGLKNRVSAKINVEEQGKMMVSFMQFSTNEIFEKI